MRLASLFLLTILTPLCAQEFSLPANIDRLSAHAKESAKVTLDGPLLQLAARFLSDQDSEQAHVKKIVAGLRGIYVRSFEFESEGEYNPADLETFRAQFRGGEWSNVVGVRSRIDGDADVYIRAANGKLGGVVVICAEPRELTIVNIVGEIDPADVVQLSGEFGIPRLHLKDKSSHRRDDQ